MLCRLLTFSALMFCLGHAAAAEEILRDGFEGELNPAFVPCLRPEGTIGVSSEVARSGQQSLRLTIEATPYGTAAWTPRPTSCLINGRENEYESDATERAELWENFDFGPRFGDDLFYGFSMWIGRDSAPVDEPTRLVIGQWKAPIDDSPFLAQRFTGGSFHVTLDVDAVETNAQTGLPLGCKILLAFDEAHKAPPAPGAAPQPVALDQPVRCEPRANATQAPPVMAHPVAVERFAFLPSPFDRWIDLVYRVRGGPDGVVEIWADGTLIARASGWIGHAGAVGQVQYFKFGPYRDPASYETSVFLDNLARGRSFGEVDPARP